MTGNRATYEGLRESILTFVEEHTSPSVRPFQNSVANWGDDWSDVAPNYLPAADLLTPALAVTV